MDVLRRLSSLRHSPIVPLLFLTLAGACSSSNSATPPDAQNEQAGNVNVTAKTASSQELRVMSFNLRVPTIFDGLNHWALRRGRLIETIRQFGPDILGTQECLAAQAEQLAGALPGYSVVAAGRNDGDRDGEMCALFVRSDRFEVLDSGHFWLSRTPERPGSRGWGSLFPRMVTWAQLRVRDNGEELCVFNTHFPHSSRNDKARLRSAQLLRERIASIAGDRPVIVTGDFNTDAGTTPYTTLVSRATHGLIDTYRAMHPRPADAGEGTRHRFWGSSRGARIDWILASARFEVLAARIVDDRVKGRYPSDHFPVTAVLRSAQPAVAAIE